MSEFEKESLSALLDGEVDELELRRVLKSSETDSSILETWDRYNLVHSALAGKAVPVDAGFADAIAAKLEVEPEHSAASVSSSSGWQQNLSKMAIAASVAIVFIVGLQTGSEPGTLTELVNNESLDSSIQTSGIEPRVVLAAGTQTEVDPEAQKRLREFIESMSFDENEPVRIEHIQDSPLYRLVNELQAKP